MKMKHQIVFVTPLPSRWRTRLVRVFERLGQICRSVWRMANRPLVLFLAGLMSTPSLAEETNGSRSLADLSIEQLMNESVTSVSKKETRLADSPAAITVITSED